LVDCGFTVLGEKRGFTQSHQIAVDVSKYNDGGTIEEDLEKSNIILNRQLLPGDIQAGRHYMHPSGVRIGANEITRLGMKENEMIEIANFIKRVVIDKEDTNNVKRDVTEFKKQYQKLKYVFDGQLEAYKYISLVHF
jgi:glycine hydroxymethyltransferase